MEACLCRDKFPQELQLMFDDVCVRDCKLKTSDFVSAYCFFWCLKILDHWRIFSNKQSVANSRLLVSTLEEMKIGQWSVPMLIKSLNHKKTLYEFKSWRWWVLTLTLSSNFSDFRVHVFRSEICRQLEVREQGTHFVHPHQMDFFTMFQR